MIWNAYIIRGNRPEELLHLSSKGFEADSLEDAWYKAKGRMYTYGSEWIVLGVDTLENFNTYCYDPFKKHSRLQFVSFDSFVLNRLKWLMENEPEKVNPIEVMRSRFK